MAIVAMMGVTSCELHSSDNGALDNWWYLRRVDNVAEGTSTDYVEQRVFWGFIGNIMQTEKFTPRSMYIYRFHHEGNTLRVCEPRINSSKAKDTLLWAKDLVKLEPHGLHMKEVTDSKDPSKTFFQEVFTIEKLDDNDMVLLNEDHTQRLHFIAY